MKSTGLQKKDWTQGKQGGLSRTNHQKEPKKPACFSHVITICHLQECLPENGLKAFPLSQCVHPGYIWSFSPRETKHKAYQPSDQVICRGGSKAQCVPPWAGGRHLAAVEKERDILPRCPGGQQPPCLSPSMMIKQEVHSEPSRSKYKNSTFTLWPHKLKLPGRKPAVDLLLDSQHAGWGSAPSWPCF